MSSTLRRMVPLALLATAVTSVAIPGCGRTPDLRPRPALDSAPAIDLLPVFTQTVNNDIDIVFLIDNSGSMKEEQENLRRNFPAFTSVLKGLPQGLPNVHIAVVSSDMGAGQFSDVPGCGGAASERGRFQSAPRVPGCTGPRGSFISALGTERNFNGDIDQVFSCIASLGTGGCGFEHQLQALRAALDPALMPPGNAGFLRDEAVLALVLLTDEDDCSAPPDTNLFDPAQMSVSQPLGPLSSFRCNEFGHLCSGARPPRTAATAALQDCRSAEDGRLIRVGEFVDFFKGLKANPDDVIVAAVTGPASPYAVTLDRRADGRGRTLLEPEISPSCTSANGSADPAVRLHQFVSAFGDNGTLLSICADDFTPVMARIGEQVARRASLECLAAPVVDVDPVAAGVQAHCQVFDETTSAGFTLRTLIPACEATAVAPCWRVTASGTCARSRLRMVVDRGGAPPIAGTRLNVTCETCERADDPRCL